MEKFFTRKNYISCTLDKFEGRFAVLKTEDNQTLNCAVDKLPSDADEGSQIKLVLFSTKSEKEEREATVKAVLNEILKTE